MFDIVKMRKIGEDFQKRHPHPNCGKAPGCQQDSCFEKESLPQSNAQQMPVTSTVEYTSPVDGYFQTEDVFVPKERHVNTPDGEKTGSRYTPFLRCWTMANLPRNFNVGDLDLFILDMCNRKALGTEVKLFDASPAPSQRKFLGIINRALSIGFRQMGWDFRGINLIQFSGKGFQDSIIQYNGRVVSEQELIKILSL